MHDFIYILAVDQVFKNLLFFFIHTVCNETPRAQSSNAVLVLRYHNTGVQSRNIINTFRRSYQRNNRERKSNGLRRQNTANVIIILLLFGRGRRGRDKRRGG